MGETKSKENGYSRRDFLKIVGATSGVAAVGCGQKPIEKLIPYVIQPDEVIPGVALWYTGTCGECSAGCGVLVRTREGRAVKLEGNPFHPVNRGGLCAIGHSALQAHYDPDRIREPLRREANGSFKPVSWADSIKEIGDALGALGADEQALLLTGSVSGSLATLIGDFTKAFPKVEHQTFELSGRETLDRAAEICFGEEYRPVLNFANAQVIVSFGADFLETWVSPVEFARQWAERRKPDAQGHISYFAHFEPRLSLTAANADRWVMNRPGSEAHLLLALLKLVYEKTNGSKLSGALKGAVGELIAQINVAKNAAEARVDLKTLDMIAKKLTSAEPSLVVAGGAAVSGANNLTCAILANIINATLGNIGATIQLVAKGSARKNGISSHEKFIETIQSIVAGTKKTKVMILSGTNPHYILPDRVGFAKALGKIGLVVAVSSHLDESTAQANIVLPLSTSLESWGDSEPLPGLHNLNQPSMQPLYASQSLGDTLLAIANKLGTKFGDAASFGDYIQAKWKERTGASGFDNRWLGYVEAGGDFDGYKLHSVVADLKPAACDPKLATITSPAEGISLLAYPSVLSADGSSANRPWLQELPNPMTSAVWGSPVEMHPDTATHLGFERGSVVQVRTEFGSIEAPVVLTKHIHPGLLAISLGQGHNEYGRYASGIGANVLKILSGNASGGALSLRVGGLTISKSLGAEELAVIQWQDDQVGRGILRSVKASELHEKLGHDNHEHHDPGKAHDFSDMEHRPQMYKQMEHPHYRWGMAVDLASCTGCSACVVACYAENNVPVVGRESVLRGRTMAWIQIHRYFDGPEHRPATGFQPMMCQHCGNAPCEPVCPVYATYHNEEGLNSMSYNRCVGTRYCANNCSYKVRRFNWWKYNWPEPLTWQLNPDVTVREVGVMEKCSFCIQRIREAQNKAKNQGRDIIDGEVQPACASSCPTKALTFGNLLDRASHVTKLSSDPRSYKVLDAVINTQPAVSYLTRVVNADEI